MNFIVYSTHPECQKIKVWNLNCENNRELHLIQTINVEGNPQAMCINIKKKVIYIGIRPNFSIFTYKINLDGTLIKIGHTKLPGSPSYISIDRNFFYIFTASYNNSLFTIHSLQESGVPNVSHKIIENIKGCHSVNIDLNNKIIFTLALLEDCIYFYIINKDGFIELHNNGKLRTEKNTGPRHMCFHPNKKYFYSINELSSTVDIWKTGKIIKKIQTKSILPSNFNHSKWAADIHITPNGKFLYTCERISNIITIFKVSENKGYIDIIGYKKTEEQPRSFSIDKTGKYLVISGQKSNFIKVYKINNKNGKLKFVSRKFAGINPIWVIIYSI